MTAAAIGADLDEALDVHSYVTAQIAFHDIVIVDAITQCCFICFAQVPYTGVGVDPGCFQDLLGAGAANAVDIGQANFNSFVLGQVNTGNTCP